MPAPYQASRRVEFRDTDAAGIMHFSAFFTRMEEVEHEFWRHLGLSVLTTVAEGQIGWPRVAARCDYHSPVKFEDVLDIELRVGRIGERSVTYDFNFTHAGRKVATGQITAVCCQVAPDGRPRSVPIPAAIVEKLRSDQL